MYDNLGAVTNLYVRDNKCAKRDIKCTKRDIKCSKRDITCAKRDIKCAKKTVTFSQLNVFIFSESENDELHERESDLNYRKILEVYGLAFQHRY